VNDYLDERRRESAFLPCGHIREKQVFSSKAGKEDIGCERKGKA